jgi:hypothetical protein
MSTPFFLWWVSCYQWCALFQHVYHACWTQFMKLYLHLGRHTTSKQCGVGPCFEWGCGAEWSPAHEGLHTYILECLHASKYCSCICHTLIYSSNDIKNRCIVWAYKQYFIEIMIIFPSRPGIFKVENLASVTLMLFRWKSPCHHLFVVT